MKLSTLCRHTAACVLLLWATESDAQILINGSSTVSYLSMGFNAYQPPAALSMSGGTPVATWAFSANAGPVMSPSGGTISIGGVSCYTLTNAANTRTNSLGYGDITIYALNGVGTKIGEKAVSIYPMDVAVPGSISYPGGPIYKDRTYTAGGNKWVNNATGYIWGITYNADNYDIIGSNTAATFQVQPKPWAPLDENVVVKMFFGPTGSGLNTANYTFASADDFLPYETVASSRDPWISSNVIGNYLCNGSNTLTVNVADNSAVGAFAPCGNAPGGSNFRLKHFTYQWYNGVNPVAGATGISYTATAAGSYYCKVSQYSQVYDAGTSSYKWECTPGVTENSNTIAVTALPPLTMSFTVNGKTGITGTPPDVWVCNGGRGLWLKATVGGLVEGYDVLVEKGTVTSGSNPVFTPTPGGNYGYGVAGMFNMPGTLDVHLLRAFFFDGLLGYVGPIRVTFTVYGCGNSQTVTQLFMMNSASALVSFLVNGPTDNNGTPSCNYLGTGKLGLQDRQTNIDAFKLENKGTLSVAAPPCDVGWLGATSVGISQATKGSSTATAIGYEIKVDEYQFDPGDSSLVFIKNVVKKNPTSLPSTLYSFNARSTPLNYFTTNYDVIKNNNINTNVNNYIYKVTVSMATTECDTIKEYSYFKIIDGGSAGSANEPELWSAKMRIGENECKVYPNPAENQLVISWTDKGSAGTEARIRIVDIMGRVVAEKAIQQPLDKHMETIDISSFASGMYHYQLQTSGRKYEGKFMKK
jgi:hypothetical protein